MAAITAVSVTITPPGGEPHTLNVDDPGHAYTGETASVVDAISIDWATEWAGGHQRPGKLAITVRSAEPDPIPYESLIVVTATIDNDLTVTIWRGWAGEPQWRPHTIAATGNVIWVTKVVADDVIGRLQATKVGDLGLWLDVSAAARLAQLAAVFGVPITGDPGIAQLGYQPADPNATVWQRIASACGRPQLDGRLIESTTGLKWVSHAAPFTPPYRAGEAPTVAATAAGIRPVRVPAGAVESGWRGPDRSSRLTVVTVNYAPDGHGAASGTLTVTPHSSVSGSSSELRLDTDLSKGQLAALTAACAELAWHLDETAATPPPLALAPAKVFPRLLTSGQLAALIGISPPGDDPGLPGRAGAWIQLDGLAYHDLDHNNTVTAGQLTIHPGLAVELTVTLTDARLAGLRGVRASDLPTVPTPDHNGTTYLPTTYALAGTVRAADLALVMAPGRYSTM